MVFFQTLRKESLLNITQVAKQKDKVQAETKCNFFALYGCFYAVFSI